MKRIVMTLKKDWYNKILTGNKTSEYREYKPYWIARLNPVPDQILFKNGYRSDSPSFVVDVVSISVVNGYKTDLKIHKKVYKIDISLTLFKN